MLKTLFKRTQPVAMRVREEGLTYLSLEALRDLEEAVRLLEANAAPGIFIEAGCALGGSAIVIARAKSRERPLYVYDVFGTIPPPTDADGPDVHARYDEIRAGRAKGIKGGQYYGYQENLQQRVTDNFARYGVAVSEANVHLVQGLFEDTLKIEQPVALAHIDGDWYSSVYTCLTQIVPHLIAGGILVIDDYDAWSGCQRAVDDYFADKRDGFRFIKRARLQIIKKPA